MRLPEIDFSSLEYKEIGTWPLILRIGVIILSVIISMFLVYWLVFSKEIDDMNAAEKKLTDTKNDFKDQYTQAVNLDAYKKQMQDMQTAYQEYIRELPAESNIPELIDSLTKIGEKNGLSIDSIKIGDAKLQSGFYMALPLTLSMTGQYHNIGLFVSDVSKLARIVTLGDFTIKPLVSSASGMLSVVIQAQTYWLASVNELEQQKPAENKAASPPGMEKNPAGIGPVPPTSDVNKKQGASGVVAPADKSKPMPPPGAPQPNEGG